MRTIHHVVDIDATKESIWRSLTEAEGLAGWWADRVNVSGTGVGALVDFVFAGDFNPKMRVHAIDPGHRLTWRCIGGHRNWDDNTFVFELVPLEDGRTRLRFTQDYAVELSDDDYGTYNFNWGYYLESLRLFCRTGSGRPYRRT